MLARLRALASISAEGGAASVDWLFFMRCSFEFTGFSQ